MSDNKRIMIIAGESSGDLHGANVVRAIRKKDPDIEFFGIGGKALRDQGVRIYLDSFKLSVVGITEVFSKIPDLAGGIKTAKRMLRQQDPDLLILIDFPDFNLYMASVAKKLDIPVLYYISPQVWAWRSGRVNKIRRLVDQMAVILPFERSFFQKHGVSVTFVGHPLLDAAPSMLNPSEPVPLTNTGLQYPVIGLLPGSRDREIMRHLPVMLRAARQLKKKFPNARFCVSQASSLDPNQVRNVIEENRQNLKVEIIAGGADKTFKQSDLLIASSGTVTLEAAIAGIPMVIIYKVSPISYKLAKPLIKVNYACLVNLIAGREIVPELIQDDVTPEKIAATAARMLNDGNSFTRMKKDLLRLRQRLGGPGASGRVADIALKMIY